MDKKERRVVTSAIGVAKAACDVMDYDQPTRLDRTQAFCVNLNEFYKRWVHDESERGYYEQYKQING